MKAKAGDVFTVYNHHMNKYAACQITKVELDGNAVCLSLDWTGSEPLRADQLDGLKPLYMDSMYWSGELYMHNVDVVVPSNYTYVGNIPPLSQKSSSSYGFWAMEMLFISNLSGGRFLKSSAGYSKKA